MDLALITVSDFKALFKKDFPFLPEWKPSPQFYNAGELVYFSPTRLFYKAKVNQTYDTPTTTSAWDVVPGDADDYIDDCDIERAFNEAKTNFNVDLWDPAQGKQAFLYLAAYYLVNDAQTSASGLAGGFTGIMSSRTVGNVSESYSVPKLYADNPLFAMFAKNGYGAKYMGFLYGRMAGRGITAVAGRTLP